MESRFDEVAKALAEGVSRREALRRLSLGLTSAFLASVGLARGSWAAPRADCRSRCDGLRGRDKNQCMGVCQSCSSASCVSGSAGSMTCCGSAGQVCCRGACVPLGTTQDCSFCGDTCGANLICTNGSCQCPQGLANCNGGCVDTATDPQNCGGCGKTCSPPYYGALMVCVNGVCGLSTCPTGQLLCSGVCVPSDANNCGRCGNICTAPSSVCLPDPNGSVNCCNAQDVCGGSCCRRGSSNHCCNGACIDLADVHNCGDCGADCSALLLTDFQTNVTCSRDTTCSSGYVCCGVHSSGTVVQCVCSGSAPA
jgi:hypothetical protein